MVRFCRLAHEEYTSLMASWPCINLLRLCSNTLLNLMSLERWASTGDVLYAYEPTNAKAFDAVNTFRHL